MIVLSANRCTDVPRGRDGLRVEKPDAAAGLQGLGLGHAREVSDRAAAERVAQGVRVSDDPRIGFLKADVARFCDGVADPAPAGRSAVLR